MSVRKSKNPVVALSAGCIAGGIEATAVWPMEYIKTQLQLRSAANLPYSGVYSGIGYTIRTTGFMSLYRGLLPSLLGSIPKAGIRFGGNTYFRNKLRSPDGKLTMLQALAAGSLAGCLESVAVVCPVETVKTKCIELNQPFMAGLAHILKNEGPMGLYKGLAATMLKQGSNHGLRFMWFGEYKAWLTGTRDPSLQRTLQPYESLLGGVSAGIFSVMCNNPFDMLKTRMQGVNAHKYSGTFDCLRQSIANEGILVCYRGAIARLGRVVPGQGIIFMSFEAIQDFISGIVEGPKK